MKRLTSHRHYGDQATTWDVVRLRRLIMVVIVMSKFVVMHDQVSVVLCCCVFRIFCHAPLRPSPFQLNASLHILCRQLQHGSVW